MVNRTSKPSANEDLGLKLLKSVREMKAGQVARVTKVEPNEVAQAKQKSTTSLRNASAAKALRSKYQ